MTLKHVPVFYEFTGTINHRLLNNQNARTILVILYEALFPKSFYITNYAHLVLKELSREIYHSSDKRYELPPN